MTKHMTAIQTHFHVFAGEDLDVFDERSAADLCTTLARLAGEGTLTRSQSKYVRGVIHEELGEPQERHATALIWRMDTLDAHGAHGTLCITVPHDTSERVTLAFVPPTRGTWVDESGAYSQEHTLLDQEPNPSDKTGGKAIAAKLLAQLARR